MADGDGVDFNRRVDFSRRVDFIDLPIPELDTDGLGPPVGRRFPDVRLPDQSGDIVDLHHHRAGRKALFIVHRSADW